MLALVAQQLTTGMQHVKAILAHTMDVIALLRETAFLVRARFVFQELFETVACQLFVFDVIGFMFLCDEWTNAGTIRAVKGHAMAMRVRRTNRKYSPISALFLNV